MTRIRRSLSLIVVLALAACQSAVSPSPPGSATPVAPVGSPLPVSPGPSGAPSGAPGGSPRPEPEAVRTGYAPAAGKKGGTVVVGDWQEANQFHPYFVSQPTDLRVAAATWSTLVTVTADGRYAPDLAASIPTTANGAVRMPGDEGDAMTVDWVLRDGLAWSDGQPLTCDDFKYAWEWVNDPGNVGVVPSGFEDISDFVCKSPTEMVWRFDRVYSGYLSLMTAPLPRHFLSAIPLEDQAAGAGFRAAEVSKLPVSGPFAFESVTPGSEIRLVRNPGYLSPARGERPYLDRLTFKWYPDVAALIAAYRRRDVHVAANLGTADVPKVANLRQQVSVVASTTYEALRPNWSPTNCSSSQAIANRGPGCPMSDPAMRQAVAAAIDRDAIAKAVPGAPVPILGAAVAPHSWFHANPPSIASDPARARSILDGAGWVAGADGIRRKDGLAARVEICTTDQAVRTATVGRVVAWLKDVGIEAVPTVVTAEQMFAHEDATAETPCALSRGNFDLAAQALTSPMEPLDAFFAYHGSQVTPNGANEASIDDPAINGVLDAVRGSVDLEVIGQALAQFQGLYVGQAVEIPLYFEKRVELVHPRLRNVAASPGRSGSTWNVADWSIQ